MIAGRDISRVRHQPQQILIDHEILPEAMPGLRVCLCEQSLNLLFGLHLGPPIVRQSRTYRCESVVIQLIAMKSYEVIREATEEPGVKAVAAALGVSPALVYKWCEPPADSEDKDQSGAKNPLDRVAEM